MKKIRKSVKCPVRSCDSVGCYQEQVTEKIFGKKVTYWKNHCKTLDKAVNRAMELVGKL